MECPPATTLSPPEDSTAVEAYLNTRHIENELLGDSCVTGLKYGNIYTYQFPFIQKRVLHRERTIYVLTAALVAEWLIIIANRDK